VVAETEMVDGVNCKFRNEANRYSASFAADAGYAYLVNIEYQGASIAFGPLAAKRSQGQKPDRLANETLREMVDSGSCVTYGEVYPGVDLVYEAKADGVKEYIVLKQPSKESEFTFSLLLEGLTVEATGGRMRFVDAEGKAVFEVGQLFAIDSNGVTTENVACTAAPHGDDYLFTVSVDGDYLDESTRAYPVIVDPSIMISGSSNTFDSFVCDRYPTTNYVSAQGLRTGYDDHYHARRTYIRFALPTSIKPNTVLLAYLRLEKYATDGGVYPQVRGYRVTGSWSSGTITWNNKPGYSSSYPSGYAYNDAGNWYRMYCTTTVSNWINGTYSNYGFALVDDRESQQNEDLWTTFHSSDAASPHKPELHINYVYCGPRPYVEYRDYGIDCAGFALALDFTPTFVTVYGIDDCDTTAELLYYMQAAFDDWLVDFEPITNIAHSQIYGFQSEIDVGNYRIVMRVGWKDMNGDGVPRYADDIIDYHFWYQTSTGRWAEKRGHSWSQYSACLTALDDPEGYDWPLTYAGNTYAAFYTSDTRYWEIDSPSY
jgi:hypothetical protein